MSTWESRRAEFVLGLAAGVVTTTVAHPLDLLKVRLQLLQLPTLHAFGQLRRVVAAIQSDARASYAHLNKTQPKPVYYLQQWYRGVGPNLIGNAAAWSIYFTLYAEYKELLSGPFGGVNGDGSTSYFGASALAGMTTSVLTNPIWVLKTRILGSSRGPLGSYKSMADGIRRILREEGLATFWRGTVPSFFMVIQASVQFSLYDQLKDWSVALAPEKLDPSQLSLWQYIWASVVSKTVSMCLLYPTQVVRSRLQAQTDRKEAQTIGEVCRLLWSNEGRFRGFYRGMGANMLRVLPSTCITFVTYETVKNSLS